MLTDRYMYEKLSGRSEVLDDRIDEVAELIREHYGIVDLGDPSPSTDAEIVVVGRISQEIGTTAPSSKLSETTITLESSRMLGSGARTALRFDPLVKIRGCAKGVEGIGLFPGSIVALKGRNGGAGWFQASEILALPPLRPSPTPEPSTSSSIPPTSGMTDSPFSMCIACGPYTLDADLQYKPGGLLFTHLKSSKPNVVLLVGPFVDSSHPRIKIGDIIDVTPFRLYEARFLAPLKSFLQASPNSIVLLVPSIRDLLSDHVVYPQSEYPQVLTGEHPRIHLLPNPACFSINGVTFAVSSVDVLFHLRREEYTKRGQEVDPILPMYAEDTGTDVMGNLCRHLLQQRSFYPLFPVPLDISHEVNLDVSHSESLRICDADGNQYAPDVLIMPSKLKEFSKTVHSTTAINPSYINKMRYTTVNVTGGNAPVKNRIKVDLLKFEQTGSGAA
ncbi:hypothetical protein AX17_005197 [Amanita inopinata Kibby_2008]|nr:hypothetical protein AX17_005197 [Amanita inopinata Kibby_2008]